MKIASVFAAMPGNHNSLLEVKKKVSETLTELGVEPEEINLGYRSLPYFDGIKSEYMHSISEMLSQVNGVIFYAGAGFGLPGALIQTLLEHFAYPEYTGIMEGKNCFVIMDSVDSYGASALSFLELALFNMGAFVSTKLLIDAGFTKEFEEGDKNFVMVERLCEDYYRALRQQRAIYKPRFGGNEKPAPAEQIARTRTAPPAMDNVVPMQDYAQARPKETGQASPGFLDRLKLDEFNEDQQRDIAELSRFFAEKFKNEDGAPASFSQEPLVKAAAKNIKPTLAQKTSALTHYYRAGQAEGIKAVIALNISGDDGFDGSIEMNGIDCDFKLGPVNPADVTIIAEDGKWRDIIQGKISAQKAFMIGQIKVRGNFVLLSRFDQLFDFQQNTD